MDRSGPTTDRRQFLGGAAGGALLALGARADAARPSFPPDVGSKFYSDGRVHRFAGNTVICHLPQQGPDAACFDALMDVYRDAPRHGFIRKVALLPPSSYHMTVFGGANDRPRVAASWPSDLALDASMEACNMLVAERLRAVPIDCPLPIRMKVDPAQDPTNGRPLTMRLLPLDQAEQAKLGSVRRQIAAATKIPLPATDAYRFHISIGYSIGWLDAGEEAEFVRVFTNWCRQVAARAPVIQFGAPEFCTFEDMYAFHRRMFL
jgi:hypothetical protein